jgi:hypothetical protein
MGQWVKCRLSRGEKMGEPKLVQWLNLDYYGRMERMHESTMLVPPSGVGGYEVVETPEQLLGLDGG